MKINESTRFPRPVLSEATQDFKEGHLEVEFGVSEDPVANTLSLKPAIELTHSIFAKELNAGNLGIHADISCKETYFNELREIKHKEELRFNPGFLSGRVVIRPVIVATKHFSILAPSDLDAEFSLEKLEYSQGDIVGWSEEHVIYVGRRKLAPIDSIFSLVRDHSIEEGKFVVNPDGDKIQICAGNETFDHIDLMRNLATQQAVIINSVYFPAIMQVLDILRSNDDYRQYDWHHTFMAKCDFYQISIGSSDLLESAQKLLRNPYMRIREVFDESD